MSLRLGCGSREQSLPPPAPAVSGEAEEAAPESQGEYPGMDLRAAIEAAHETGLERTGYNRALDDVAERIRREIKQAETDPELSLELALGLARALDIVDEARP